MPADLIERLEKASSRSERNDMGIGDYWNLCDEAAAALRAKDAEDVFAALDLDPESFRTEGGAVNVNKLRAAIVHPGEYLPDGHWLRAAQEQPVAYLCPAGCGCTWRDNYNGTMSLFGKNSRSCEVCEYLPLSGLTPVYAAPPAQDAEDAARLAEIREIYAGMDGFVPQTAAEGYCLEIIRKMAHAAIGVAAREQQPKSCPVCNGTGEVHLGESFADCPMCANAAARARRPVAYITYVESMVSGFPKLKCSDKPKDGYVPVWTDAALAAAREQQPVAWMVYTLDGKSVCVTDNPADFTPEHRALPLYAAPPAPDAEDAARWRDLVSHQKFNNQPQVGFAINQAIKRVAARGSEHG